MLTGSPYCFAQTSPVGVWDCVIGGTQKGVAYITFNSDNTLAGYEVVAPRIKKSSGSSERGGDGFGRNDEESVNAGDNTVFVGFFYISGEWVQDANGRLVGFLAEGNDNVSCEDTTEVVTTYVTNIVDGETQVTMNMMTNIITTCVTNAVTNAVSFVGKVSSGRLAMKTTAPNGRSNIKGVTQVDLADYSGEYLAEANKNGSPYNEFHSLSEDSDPGFPNSYYTDGTGPGYETHGYAVFSSKNKMAWVLAQSDPAVPLISVFGSYNSSKGKAKLVGRDSTDLDPAKYRYKLTGQPAFD